jgi:4-hydroxy-tetrahydrodipicolinate synthase
MPPTPPFWKTKRLEDMSTAEWESLCDGCGRCCLHKLRDDHTNDLAFTNVACRLLDLHSCQCSDYLNRRRRVPDCVQLTPAEVRQIDWLPPSCAYRRLAEGKDLAWWHPLVSGDPDTVHQAGVSVRGRAINERRAGPLEAHIAQWPGRSPRTRRPTQERPVMMQNALFGGVNAAVLTPMNADLSVDLGRMAAHCRWLLASGCNGLGVLGTTGEANSIGISERLAVLEGLVERGIPAAKMMPGTGTPALTDTVLLTRKANELGCRGALLLPPFYYKNPSDDGLLAYFGEVIQRVGGDISIYLYNFPQQSAVPFSVDFIGRLLKLHPGKVKGVKDSSGSYENGLAYVQNFAKDGFEVYAGDDTLLRPLLEQGGAGCITAASNVGCSVAARVYAGWNTPAGAAAHEVLSMTRKAVISVPLIPGLKALVARNTGDPRWHNIRPPHLRLRPAQEHALFTAFDACGVVMAKAA